MLGDKLGLAWKHENLRKRLGLADITDQKSGGIPSRVSETEQFTARTWFSAPRQQLFPPIFAGLHGMKS